jgi:hypothetical protein
MGMMKMIGNVGRKFRTAYMKKSRRKVDMPKLSPDWNARLQAGEDSAHVEFRQQQNSARAYIERKLFSPAQSSWSMKKSQTKK